VHRARRRPTSPLPTLALSVGLAVLVGTSIYLAVTSLPFLATSPTADPTFGALNQCLLDGAPQRVGFAVGRDARRAAAWTTDRLVACRAGAAPTTWRLPGVTVGAWDARDRLWVAARGADAGASGLFLASADALSPRGELSPQALVGTAAGVVALEPSGRLVSLDDEGRVLGVRDLGWAAGATLSSSGDGRRVAVVGGGGLVALDAVTLEPLLAAAPCDVRRLWWLTGSHRALVACGADERWALALDVDTGHTEAAPERPRVDSALAGPEGPWVRACDVLPCTAEPP
jgi:hypothetical protein